MVLSLTNKQARHLLIATHGLGTPPTGKLDVPTLISEMGFVQIDSIRNVTRAHHHILWSRNQNYREPMLWQAVKDRQLFEHFTHDASILPIDMYPLWQWQFKRLGERVGTRYYGNVSTQLCEHVKDRIRAEGALCTKAFDTKLDGPKEMWARPPHKRALDYMWYKGELATSHRENFTKFYDLPERVIPDPLRQTDISLENQFNSLCTQALTHLTIATPADLQDFWGAASAQDIKTWLNVNGSRHIPITMQAHDGSYIDGVAVSDIQAQLAVLKPPTTRLRILNPFDPLIRNRKRLHRIFGFEYTIEIFVPKDKRRWGYYVYPLLEGDRFVGRIELNADRKSGTLSIVNFWPESKIKWTGKRKAKLAAELGRLARFINVAPPESSHLATKVQEGMLRA